MLSHEDIVAASMVTRNILRIRMKKSLFLALVPALFLVGCSHSGMTEAQIMKLPRTPEANATDSFLAQMHKKYGHDASKLTPEERAKMDQITRGHTDIEMRDGGK